MKRTQSFLAWGNRNRIQRAGKNNYRITPQDQEIDIHLRQVGMNKLCGDSRIRVTITIETVKKVKK